MPWNWQLSQWPQWRYDSAQIAAQERDFLLRAGQASAVLQGVEKMPFIVDILSAEGLQSARIEGEVLNRESLQSSLRRQFGLQPGRPRESRQEAHMAALLCSAYTTYDQPLTHEMLWQWQEHLFGVREGYRTHPEPMQIVSSRYDRPLIFFEAPPSDQIPEEMEAFIRWFNTPSASVLGRAAIAHIYFESIHPFEDGNGRIGRALVEKVLSQGIGQPTLIAVSTVLERRKKEYYAALEQCNNTLDAASFVRFFAEVVLEAQAESMRQLQFLMYKTRLLERLKGQLNARQEKAVLRLFAAGPEGFQGGFSAENYIAITRAPRATATRDLTDLVEKGALLKTGELRYTRYALNVR